MPSLFSWKILKNKFLKFTTNTKILYFLIQIPWNKFFICETNIPEEKIMMTLRTSDHILEPRLRISNINWLLLID